MRKITIALLTTGLLVAPSVQASTKRTHHKSVLPPPACQFDGDRSAFDIEGLKSELMVTALVCKKQDRYNVFMSRYQPDVQRQEVVLAAYFKRSYGKSNQKAYDEYITNLADVQEQDGLKAGTAFCDNLPAMFDEVMSLHDSSELLDYTHSKPMAQPMDFAMCTGAPPTLPASKSRHHTVQHG